MDSINPVDGTTIAHYDAHAPEQVDEVLDRSVNGAAKWAATPLADRAAALERLADLLERDAERLGHLITTEMGKPIAQARAEANKCAWAARHYAAHAREMLAPQQIEMDDGEAYVQYLPLGEVLGIMPWNYPLCQAFRAAVPIMAAGNGFLLMHAGNVSGCALAMRELVAEAGFPGGAFEVVLISGSEASSLLSDPRIAAATLTGSERAGSAMAASAGEELKKTVLELGGSDPYVVLADADVTAAAQTAVTARFQNTGQSCIAAKRFLVVEDVADEFIQTFVDGATALTQGDPTDENVYLGPLARPDLRDNVADQVQRTVEAGGTVLTGGETPQGPGAFYPATVVVVPDTTVPMMQEEVFGPAAAVLRVPDEATAVEVANQTGFGLSSSLWTNDLDRGRELAGQIHAGGCYINSMVASDPRLPFGGIKRSGYGRELAWFGITEFTNAQTVRVATSSP